MSLGADPGLAGLAEADRGLGLNAGFLLAHRLARILVRLCALVFPAAVPAPGARV